MKRRRLWLGLALLLIVTASFLLPAVRWRMIGWARGEAFYQGRPTSFWKREMQRCEMLDFFLSGDLYFAPPKPTPLEEWLKQHLGVEPAKTWEPSRPVEMRDPAAIPVLVELLRCDDPQARLIAIQSLGAQGAEARSALPALREVARTTQQYLIYREAGRALYLIDPQAPKEEERADHDQLWQQYKPGTLKPVP